MTLNTSNVGTSEVARVGLVPNGAVGDYVSGTSGNGDIRIRIRCTRVANFTSRGELLYVDYLP
jgi:hypothetical protein